MGAVQLAQGNECENNEGQTGLYNLEIAVGRKEFRERPKSERQVSRISVVRTAPPSSADVRANLSIELYMKGS